MKKILFALAFAALFTTGCKVKLDPVAEPSWYVNQTYFQEKNGMYLEMPVDTSSVVLMGDDYIDRGEWSEMFQDKRIKNRGITYNATEHVLYLIDSIAIHQPKKIFVSAGYYDIQHGTSTDTIVSNLQQIFHRASLLSPKSELYYINIVGRAGDEDKGETIRSVNEVMSTLQGVTYVDLNSKLAEGVLDGTYSWNGGKYLNGAGYQVMAEYLMEYVGRLAFNAAVAETATDSTFTDYYRHRISMYRSLPRTLNEIVMLGNSLNNNAMWLELFPTTKVHNRGISGDVLKGVEARLDEVIPDAPHKIFLMTGSNDIVNDPDIAVTELWARYESLIKKIKKEMPYTFLYVQSVLPVNPKFSKYEGFNDKAAQLNKLLEAGCETYNYFYLDIAKYLMDEKGDLRDDCTYDGIHLSPLGYFLWANELLKGNRLMILEFGINKII